MVPLKTEKEIDVMKEGGRILAEIMEKLKESVQPGITTKDLEKRAKEETKRRGAQCAFLNYRVSKHAKPYPACLCTSVNEELVHVPPSERILKEGDLLKLDFGILWKGYYLDMAMTLGVGKISFLAQRLIKVTKKALKLAIQKARSGNTFGEIGNTIERYVESQGFNVIRDLCGHGIGKRLHEEPKVLNYGSSKSGEKIEVGMVFCIEPMVSAGSFRLKKTKDGFGYQTEDHSLCAHFEHTIAISKNGPVILTKI